MAKALPKKPPKREDAVKADRQHSFDEPDLEVTSGVVDKPIKAILYGAGGVGKTTLASLLSKNGLRVRFVDVEESSDFVDAERVHPRDWFELRGYLRGNSILEADVVVLDSLTRCVNYCTDFVVETIPHEKKEKTIQRLEDYGWGKGVYHLHDCFLPLLSDLDSLVAKGKHVICTAHECTSVVPNPDGEDFF